MDTCLQFFSVYRGFLLLVLLLQFPVLRNSTNAKNFGSLLGAKPHAVLASTLDELRISCRQRDADFLTDKLRDKDVLVFTACKLQTCLQHLASDSHYACPLPAFTCCLSCCSGTSACCLGANGFSTTASSCSLKSRLPSCLSCVILPHLIAMCRAEDSKARRERP